MPKVGYKQTEEHKQNLRKPKPEGFGLKISILKTGIPFLKEHRKNLSKAWNNGLTKETDERVKKYSDKLKGNPKSFNAVIKQSETRKRLFREGKLIHPNWQGGKSFEPYGVEFNRELKEEIRRRDNFTCQECGFNQEQLRCTLDVHHIDFNKQNNQQNNLISLCKSCHTKTQFNRQNWIDYFRNKSQ